MKNTHASLVLACAVLVVPFLAPHAALQSVVPSGPRWSAPAPNFPLTIEQMEFLSHVSMVDLPDGQGGTVRTARISGINVQIVNGSGHTDGRVDGLGNLIVGYNEAGHPDGDERTGSHNLIVGLENNYSSFGGLVAGSQQTISGPFATVGGGLRNMASGTCSSVSGGQNNTASGGGTVYGAGGSVSGGTGNTASGYASSCSGGLYNSATGFSAAVSGGQSNAASGGYAYAGWIYQSGGSVSGGRLNAAASLASVSGGLGNTASGSHSSVSGGGGNTALGTTSSVSGGSNRTAPAQFNWAAGGLLEDS